MSATGPRLVTLALAALLAPSLAAQTGGLELTAYAGPNYSWLTGPGQNSIQGRVGVSIGLRLHQPVGGNFSVDPDIGFAYKGANARVNTSATETAARLWYLQFPVPMRLTLAGTGSVRPRISAGPFIAVRVGCTAELQTGGSLSQESCSDLRSLSDTMIAFDPFKSWDAGFVASAGFSLPVGRTKFDFEFRYEHGMINISRTTGPIHNRTLLLAVGVPF